MTTIEAWNWISQQLNIYCGLPMLVFGLVGCLWNILVFRHYSLRRISCCTYLLAGSIASIVQLLVGLVTRILADGFHIDRTMTNAVWCKLRNYTVHCASLMTLSCLVWATLDRFLSTRRQLKWRYLNSVYLARQICLWTLIVWMSATIPSLLYSRPIQIASTAHRCTSSSWLWSKIVLYFFNLCCYGLLPWFFMGLFGYLTLRRVRQTSRCRIQPLPAVTWTRLTRIEKQLTFVLFLQMITCILSSIPYLVQSIYESATESLAKSLSRQAQEHFFLQIARLTFYINFVFMFYINYIFSSILRRLSNKVLINLFKEKMYVSRETTIINHPRHTRSQSMPRHCTVSTIPVPFSTTVV